MCGIAGVISWSDKYRTSRQTLARMSAAIAHRGPDGEGAHISHENEVTPDRPQAALAFRRLAILDPDHRSNQPFTDHQGRWLVFNGEIYNYRELRKELSSLDPSYQWRTTGDTEVLLRSYAQWSENCVHRLNGMFAFGIWNENKKELFLARDRMGQKPLYIASQAIDSQPGLAAIAFASELSAMRVVPWVDTSLDPGSLTAFLRWGYNADWQTIYFGVQQLDPAQWLRCSAASQSGDNYFSPQHSNRSPVPVARTKELVHQVVQRQLVSDVPLGCFLSGGVDSSVIARAAQDALPRGERLRTFSIAFEDPRYDESDYARRVAGHLGTEHRTFTVRPDAAADLPALARVFGQPFADSSALPTHYLSRETRQHVKVALSGDGGDELFGGYDRYRAIRWAHQLQRMLPRPLLTELATQLSRHLPAGHPKSLAARARRFFISLPLPLAAQYASYLRIFDEPTLNELWPDAFPADPCSDIAHCFAHQYTDDPVPAALATDRQHYLPGDLLVKLDRASMLHALEVRSPFMDPDLVSFAAGLTTDQLLKGGPKRMLREAFAADLPDFVFKRRKMGFAVPIGDWLRTSLRDMLHDHLFAASSFARGNFNLPVVERLVHEHESQTADHSQRLYALLMLELWWRLQKM